MGNKRIILLFPGLLVAWMCMFAQEKVQPEKGDGIQSLLIRHHRPGPEYRKQFIALNKGKLGKDNSLLLGVSYTLPPLRKKKTTATPTAGKTPAKPAAKDQYAVGMKKREPLF